MAKRRRRSGKRRARHGKKLKMTKSAIAARRRYRRAKKFGRK